MSTFRIKRFTKADKKIMEAIRKTKLDLPTNLTSEEMANLERLASIYKKTGKLASINNPHVQSALKKIGIQNIADVKKLYKKFDSVKNKKVHERFAQIYGGGSEKKAIENRMKLKDPIELDNNFQESSKVAKDSFNKAMGHEEFVDKELASKVRRNIREHGSSVITQKTPGAIVNGQAFDNQAVAVFGKRGDPLYQNLGDKFEVHRSINDDFRRPNRKYDSAVFLGHNTKDVPAIGSHEEGHIKAHRSDTTRIPNASEQLAPEESFESLQNMREKELQSLAEVINEGGASHHSLATLKQLGADEKTLEKSREYLKNAGQTYSAGDQAMMDEARIMMRHKQYSDNSSKEKENNIKDSSIIGRDPVSSRLKEWLKKFKKK